MILWRRQMVPFAKKCPWSFCQDSKALLGESQPGGDQPPSPFTWPDASPLFPVPSSEKFPQMMTNTGHQNMKKDVNAKWNTVALDVFNDCVLQLSERHKMCTAVKGDYSEGKRKNCLLIFGHVVLKLCQTYILNCPVFLNTFQSIYSIFFFRSWLPPA
jgi:hypothetical protein